MRRLQYQAGQLRAVVSRVQKEQGNLPEVPRAEVLLLAANSQRQLGNSKEARALYRQIITKVPWIERKQRMLPISV